MTGRGARGSASHAASHAGRAILTSPARSKLRARAVPAFAKRAQQAPRRVGETNWSWEFGATWLHILRGFRRFADRTGIARLKTGMCEQKLANSLVGATPEETHCWRQRMLKGRISGEAEIRGTSQSPRCVQRSAERRRRSFSSVGDDDDYDATFPALGSRSGGPARPCAARGGAGHHQDRRAALPVRHHGHQRDDPEGSDPDAGCRVECQRRSSRQEDRAGGGRSGFQLAPVRRKSARSRHTGEGRGRVRMLDLGLAQIRAAGVRGVERSSVLSARVRRRGAIEEHLLWRVGAGQQGDPRRRVSDERGRRQHQALDPRRHGLRVSAHEQQDHPRLPEVERRRGRGHPRELHALRLLGLADGGCRDQGVRLGGQEAVSYTHLDVYKRQRELHALRLLGLADGGCRDQGVRLGGQEDGGRVHRQRRREHSLLQGARQPGHQGERHSRHRLLHR